MIRAFVLLLTAILAATPLLAEGSGQPLWHNFEGIRYVAEGTVCGTPIIPSSIPLSLFTRVPDPPLLLTVTTDSGRTFRVTAGFYSQGEADSTLTDLRPVALPINMDVLDAAVWEPVLAGGFVNMDRAVPLEQHPRLRRLELTETQYRLFKASWWAADPHDLESTE